MNLKNDQIEVSALADRRFRSLMGEAAWQRLPARIQNRFGKRVKGGESVVYQGQVTSMDANWFGLMLAHLARLVGAPLPFDKSCVGQPAVVIVTEDIAGDGQFWIRQYGRKSGFPQMVHSSKRFAGPTGLEEYLGFGMGMALRVEARSDALLFKSDHYFLQLGKHRLRLPKTLGPGRLVIGHHDLGDGRFRFSLSLSAKGFGQYLSQDILFHDGVA